MHKPTLLEKARLLFDKIRREPTRCFSPEELACVMLMLLEDLDKEIELSNPTKNKEERDKKLKLISHRLTLVSLPKEMIINPTHGPKLTALVTEINMHLENLTGRK